MSNHKIRVPGQVGILYDTLPTGPTKFIYPNVAVLRGAPGLPWVVRMDGHPYAIYCLGFKLRGHVESRLEPTGTPADLGAGADGRALHATIMTRCAVEIETPKIDPRRYVADVDAGSTMHFGDEDEGVDVVGGGQINGQQVPPKREDS